MVHHHYNVHFVKVVSITCVWFPVEVLTGLAWLGPTPDSVLPTQPGPDTSLQFRARSQSNMIFMQSTPYCKYQMQHPRCFTSA